MIIMIIVIIIIIITNLSNPATGENIISGNLVMETGCRDNFSREIGRSTSILAIFYPPLK